MQNLSLDSAEPRTIAVPEPAKKAGHGQANEVPKTFNPNASYVPNGHPSISYYYGGYDGQGDWNDWNVYQNYVNANGGMAQGVYRDSGSYMYPQGYGYAPYGSYPSPSTSPSLPHNDKLYGLQQYQYPSYYQPSASANGTYGATANKTNAQGGKTSTPVTAEHVPSSVMNKGSTTTMTNGYSSNNNVSNDSYQRAGYAAYAPVSGYAGTYGTQPSYPSDPLLFSDRQSKNGSKTGYSTPAVPRKDFSSQRNYLFPSHFHNTRFQNCLRETCALDVEDTLVGILLAAHIVSFNSYPTAAGLYWSAGSFSGLGSKSINCERTEIRHVIEHIHRNGTKKNNRNSYSNTSLDEVHVGLTTLGEINFQSGGTYVKFIQRVLERGV